MCWVESIEEDIWLTPFAADHHIVSRLVPEVIAKGGGVTSSFPVTLHREGVPIHQHKASYRIKDELRSVHIVPTHQ